MNDPHVITALVSKRSELAGGLIKLDKQRAAIKSRLSHVDQTLKMFGYQDNPNQIAPRCRYVRLFKRGELHHIVAEIMRKAQSSMPNKEIAAMVIRMKGWDSSDTDLLDRVTQSVKPSRRSIDRKLGRTG